MNILKNAVIIVIIVFLAIAWILPVYVMFTTSFKTLAEVSTGHYLSFPTRFQFENWKQAFNILKLPLKNSFIVSLCATFITVFIGSWSGYALARFKFKGRNGLFFMIAIVTFLPYQIFLIPLTRLIVSLGLFNTLSGMILSYVILNTPMATLITSLFFRTIPKELQEAAFLDGCGPVIFYFKILIPISVSGLMSAAVLSFVNIWNEFIIALSLSRDPTTRLAIPVVAGLKGSYVAQWNMLMAGAAIVSIPGILVLLFFGKFFIKGLIAGAMKE
ncbi:carbohydrate ABC transporter permease [Thermotoga sp. KOL6]|uniref:carbohydrate ABC transporter permease n=1 Tax=Thermotoga sp. KOL6 TaxID=126741 RepID=UPI000C77760E|nr:carbohydrate ABC transporter permease [Thermotoga sp. KOL6]PLV60044.1 hypothetical protein AS005_01780 [Thermotoga sp. KOL6]